MKVLLYGRNGSVPRELVEMVSKFKDLEIVQKDPEVVITFGGDGTLIGSEAVWPGIVKLPLKNSENCHLCYPISNSDLLFKLTRGELIFRNYKKLEARISAQVFTSFADIVIAHKYPNSAIRFIIEQFGDLVYIGDGVVCSTPFGSTGYFYSITRSSFQSGFGIALNNIHNSMERERVMDWKEKIKIKVLRGPAVLAWDNDPGIIDLTEGQEVIIQKSKQFAKILAPIGL